MEKVFVALSGGVDSAVTAHILKNRGYDVTGVFIRVWQPDFLPCTQDEEERAALRVAAALGIPFKRLDLSEEYKRDVVDTMISEYRAGRTPNPDVLCNASIKFGAFLDFALAKGADKIATGHHARVHEKDGTYALLRGVDASKDQAYFLWKLSTRELAHTLMPVGEMTKDEVREYAKTHAIPSAFKPDSQGLCFIGHVDMQTFLTHFITTKPGDVLNEEGNIVGAHEGAELVTLGQRGGFTITDKELHGKVLYVTHKDIERNTITVSDNPVATSHARREVTLSDVRIRTTLEDKSYQGEIRYHGAPIACRINVSGEREAHVALDEDVLMAPGQSLVLYNGDVCIGGGIAYT